eukprot:GEZU01039303.1.p1 GENE.GEZU01039303.1~~GEZU01039303.1.p1  ORF type:complete len:680 (+),score=148.66 GEZU01039303.1:119-2158(+)
MTSAGWAALGAVALSIILYPYLETLHNLNFFEEPIPGYVYWFAIGCALTIPTILYFAKEADRYRGGYGFALLAGICSLVLLLLGKSFEDRDFNKTSGVCLLGSELLIPVVVRGIRRGSLPVGRIFSSFNALRYQNAPLEQLTLTIASFVYYSIFDGFMLLLPGLASFVGILGNLSSLVVPWLARQDKNFLIWGGMAFVASVLCRAWNSIISFSSDNSALQSLAIHPAIVYGLALGALTLVTFAYFNHDYRWIHKQRAAYLGFVLAGVTIFYYALVTQQHLLLSFASLWLLITLMRYGSALDGPFVGALHWMVGIAFTVCACGMRDLILMEGAAATAAGGAMATTTTAAAAITTTSLPFTTTWVQFAPLLIGMAFLLRSVGTFTIEKQNASFGFVRKIVLPLLIDSSASALLSVYQRYMTGPNRVVLTPPPASSSATDAAHGMVPAPLFFQHQLMEHVLPAVIGFIVAFPTMRKAWLTVYRHEWIVHGKYERASMIDVVEIALAFRWMALSMLPEVESTAIYFGACAAITSVLFTELYAMWNYRRQRDASALPLVLCSAVTVAMALTSTPSMILLVSGLVHLAFGLFLFTVDMARRRLLLPVVTLLSGITFILFALKQETGASSIFQVVSDVVAPKGIVDYMRAIHSKPTGYYSLDAMQNSASAYITAAAAARPFASACK